MLKNVVFPAPLSPMIDTIAGNGEAHVLDRHEAAEHLGHVLRDQQRFAVAVARDRLGACLPRRSRPGLVHGFTTAELGVAGAHALAQLELPSSLGDETLRAGAPS